MRFRWRGKRSDPTDFDALVREFVHELSGHAEVIELGDDAVQVGPHRLSLTNLRRRWGEMPAEERSMWLRSTLREMFGEDVSALPIRDQLRPGVRSASTLATAALSVAAAGSRIPSRSIAADLCWVVVVDQPNTMMLASETLLAEMGFDFDGALAIAFENQAVAGPAELEGWAVMSDDGGPLVASPVSESDYIASTLLADGALADVVVPELRTAREFVVFVPTRTMCLVVDVDDAAGLVAAAQMAADSRDRPGPVSLRPVVGGRSGWRALTVPADHPAAEALRTLEILESSEGYLAQRQVLAESLGEGAFVAEFVVASEPASDRILSYTVWSDGVVALLPVAEHVAFFSDQLGSLLVPWVEVERIVGDLMTDTDHHPGLVLVESFPSAGEWASLERHAIRP